VLLAEGLYPAAEPDLFFFRLFGPLGQHSGELPQDRRLPRYFDELLQAVTARVDGPHHHRVADAGQRQTPNPHGSGLA